MIAEADVLKMARLFESFRVFCSFLVVELAKIFVRISRHFVFGMVFFKAIKRMDLLIMAGSTHRSCHLEGVKGKGEKALEWHVAATWNQKSRVA